MIKTQGIYKTKDGRIVVISTIVPGRCSAGEKQLACGVVMGTSNILCWEPETGEYLPYWIVLSAYHLPRKYDVLERGLDIVEFKEIIEGDK